MSYCSSATEKKVLVCGDGDLSYGASIAEEMAGRGVQLTVSVLETRETHGHVFGNSESNVRHIERCGHTVRFDTDATKLESYEDLGGPFDRIQFNFPHCRGKMNIARNRRLLNKFFASCTRVLISGGQVHVALMERQGGAFARNLATWKQSWKPAQYAAEHDLLLVDVVPFKMDYVTSAYRFKDLPFRMRGDPHLYVFAAPGAPNYHAPERFQMYCHYQIIIQCSDRSVPAERDWTFDLERHIKKALPSGWRVAVRCVALVDGSKLRYPVEGKLASHQVYFFGEEKAMVRDEAESIRAGAVTDAIEKSELDVVTRGIWLISNVYPSSILEQYGKQTDDDINAQESTQDEKRLATQKALQ